MKKWLLMGRRFLGAVMLGAILSIYLLQNTQRTRNYFARFIQEVFATQLKSNFSGTVRSINLFTLTVVFQDVTVKSVDAHDDWFWKADIFKISGSLWRLMSHHLMDLHMNLEQLYTYSAMNAGSLALTSHLDDIFLCYGDNLPFDLKNLSIKDGLLRVKHSNGYTADISWNNDFERDTGKDRARFFLKNLKVYSDAATIIDHGSGTIQVLRDDAICLFTDIRFANVYSDALDNPYFLTGSWEKNKGDWFFTSLSGNCTFDTVSLRGNDTTITAALHGRLASNLIHPLLGTAQECAVTGAGTYDRGTAAAQGSLKIDSLASLYGAIDCLTATIAVTHEQYEGTVMAQKDQYQIGSAWSWDAGEKMGSVSVGNEKDVAFPQSYWIIPAGKLEAKCTFDDAYRMDGTIACIGEHEKLHASVRCNGVLSADGSKFSYRGQLGNRSGSISGIMQFPYITQLMVRDQDKECISGAIHDEQITVSIDYDFIHALLPESYKRHMLGNGMIMFDGRINKERLTGAIVLHNGTIQVPMTDNFIDGITGRVDLDMQERTLMISDCAIAFHQGALTSSQITIIFDQWNVPRFINAPIIIDNWFLNWQKHCSTLFSGTVHCVKEHEKVALEGALFLDDSRINQSFLSEQMQNIFGDVQLPFWFNAVDTWSFNGTCITRKPIAIDTALIKTQCTLDTHITGSPRALQVDGSVSFIGGQLYFPYKSLNITKGRLNFTGTSWQDAYLELYAKNRIKRYMVDMHVSGFFAKPHVHFDAQPTLRQEQILALLLGGSEKGSLSTSVPAIVVHNAYSWLFGLTGNAGEPSILKKFLHSLNRIHFVPTVSRAKGLQGTFEIDLTDKLHASIQKDFTNQEQASLELEYQLNNALSLRGRRDERGDLEADIEVRWKF